MKFNFKIHLWKKILIINLLAVITSFAIASLIIISTSSKVNENMIVDTFTKQAYSALVAMRTELFANSSNNKNITQTFNDSSQMLSNKLSQEFGVKVIIFSRDKKVLSTSSYDELINLDVKNLSIINESLNGNRAYTIKMVNNERKLYFSFPVSISKEVIGSTLLVYSLETNDKNMFNMKILTILGLISAILITFLITYIFIKKLTLPLVQLKNSTSKISEGDYSMKITNFSQDEIGDLANAFNKMSIEIENKMDIIEFEKNKLNQILSSMGESVIAFDSNSNIILINTQAKLILTSDLRDYLHSITLDIFEKKSRYITEYYDKENNKKFVINANILNANDTIKNIHGVVIILNDVTELKSLREKQQQFLTNVSHELKTPLATIIGYIDLLKYNGDNKDIFKKSMKYLEEACERLERLVNDLIELKNLSRLEFTIEKSTICIETLIKEIIGQMSLKAAKFDISLKSSLVKTPKMLLDSTRIKQVLVNIIDNAIKFSDSNSTIFISLKDCSSFIEICVKDEGIGLSKEELKKIFDPFYRTKKSQKPGSGLGLAICKEIIEKHDGTIRIESKENIGSNVIISLPI